MAHKMTHTPPARVGGKPSKADLTQVPIEHLDLEKVSNLADLLDGYAKISFQARTLGQCAQVLERMMLDPLATVYFGGAGGPLPGGAPQVPAALRGVGPLVAAGGTRAFPFHHFYHAPRRKHTK